MRTQPQSHGFSRFGVFAPHEMAAITLAPFPFPGWSARLQIPPSPCRRALMNASILIATSLQDSVCSRRRGHSGKGRRAGNWEGCATPPPQPGGLPDLAGWLWRQTAHGTVGEAVSRIWMAASFSSLRGVWCVTETPRCSQARPWDLQ